MPNATEAAKKPRFKDKHTETRSLEARLKRLDQDEKIEVENAPQSIHDRYAQARLELLKGAFYPETLDLLVASKAITPEAAELVRAGGKDSDTLEPGANAAEASN